MAHARLLFGLAGPLTGLEEDALALGRRPKEYRNAVLCERPNGDWGYTVARQFLYDTADDVRLEALAGSSWKELADLVAVIRLEERYHLDHAGVWFERLAKGPAEGRQRYAQGLAAAMGEAVALFEPLPGERQLVADGILPRSNEEVLADWLGRIGAMLEDASLDFVLERFEPVCELVQTGSGEMPRQADAFATPDVVRRDGRWVHEGGFAGAGGRRGRHSEDFLPLWEEMTMLYRAHPGATW
jgi:ring-1,2-phenylacetyl-CoA epoxidase subunit PaaC